MRADFPEDMDPAVDIPFPHRPVGISMAGTPSLRPRAASMAAFAADFTAAVITAGEVGMGLDLDSELACTRPTATRLQSVILRDFTTRTVSGSCIPVAQCLRTATNL
jgi:hypothetical protein